jgi:hypothetical protein
MSSDEVYFGYSVVSNQWLTRVISSCAYKSYGLCGPQFSILPGLEQDGGVIGRELFNRQREEFRIPLQRMALHF